MAQQVVGLFDTIRDAQAAVRDLQSSGIDNADISFVGSNGRGEYDETGRGIGAASGAEATADAVGGGATGGAVAGGLAGVLVGLGALAIPGIGPVLAAGPFAAAIGTTGAAVGAGAIGAGLGAVTGGLVGGLVGAGVPEEDANVYAEGVRRGGALVMARVADNQVGAAIDIMDRNNVVDIEQRRQDLQGGGWSRHEESAGPYDYATAAGTGAEREVGGATTQGTMRRARPYAGGGLAGATAGYEGRMRGEMVGDTHALPAEPGLDNDLDRDPDGGAHGTRNV